MASPHLADQVGRVLDGRYRVVAPIGTGASAAVFLADDVVLRRRVALKVLHAALAGDQSFLKRFQAEAHTAAGLSHPNIMRVLDWGEAGDGPFLVLEYLGGGSLRSVLDDSATLTVEQAIAVGLQACRALEYAHRRGLVHRDVKPANLLFDEEGRLAIADFGLARALAEAAWTEPGGAVLGTARYASPEQVRGQSLDGKADVYALGLVLIEAVCGYVPFTADTTIATLMARLDVQLEAPPEMGPLGEIVEKATNPDPSERVDAAEMVRMLDQAASESTKPDPIRLPGAIPLDRDSIESVDPTMLPGSSAPRPSSSPHTPMPSAEVAKSRRNPFTRFRRSPRSEAPRARRRPSLKKVLIGLMALVLAGVFSGGAYVLYYYTGTQRVVPPLEGVSLDAARATAHQAKVKLVFDGEEFSETVAPGLTFNETPGAGGKVHPREAVHLKVSKGPAPRDVINVTGQQLEQARIPLADKGFVVTTEERYDENAPTGKVLAQSPNSGLQPRGAEIHLVISKGPPPRTVPDVKGQSYDAAVAAITALQLKVARSDGFSDTVPAGQVAGTSPGPGASVARGGTVTVIVSKGPDVVTVPDVRGQSAAAAMSTLQGEGFQVVNVFGPGFGTVFYSTPPPGTKAKRGADISLYTQ